MTLNCILLFHACNTCIQTELYDTHLRVTDLKFWCEFLYFLQLQTVF